MKLELDVEEVSKCLEVILQFVWRKAHKAKRLDFVFVDLKTGQTTYIKGDGTMAYTLPVDRKVTALIQPVDQFGNPAKVDGIPVWTASDPTFLTVTPSADGLSCVVEPVGPLGTSQLRVEGDADLGDGVKPIIGLADVEAVAGEAVAFNIQFGTPEPR